MKTNGFFNQAGLAYYLGEFYGESVGSKNSLYKAKEKNIHVFNHLFLFFGTYA
jgi:hypothetical protein